MITARAFAGKHYAVYGLARSGIATVEALLASGKLYWFDATLDGRPLRVAPGRSLAQSLGDHDPDLLALLLGGSMATDARGLPVDADAPVTAGAIYRVQRSARIEDAADA